MTKPRIFMTGASGYIGSVITEFAIAQGYAVHGLSRSEKSDTKLTSLSAVPVRGDLHILSVLSRESAAADIVIHLADAWAGNMSMPYDEVIRIDGAAVDAIAESLKGTNKPLVVMSGTLVVAPDPSGSETVESSPLEQKPLNARIRSETHALEWSRKGVNVSAVRLAPFVYGRGGSGVSLFMKLAVGSGEVTYVGDGAAHTSVVHVDDAARLYLLVVEKAKAGDIFNATSSTDVTFCQLAEAMGDVLRLPVRSLAFAEVAAKTGEKLARFLSAPNRASNAKAVRELGWLPKEVGILEDIRTGSYVAVAEELRKGGA